MFSNERETRARRCALRGLATATLRETIMPRGDKSSYTDKQKRQAEHIEEGYEHRGVGKRKPNRACGLRSTRRPAAATRAARDAASPIPKCPRNAAAGLADRAAARLPQAVRPRRDRAPRRKRPRPASEPPRQGRERAKPRESDSSQATSAASSAAGATKSAPHCAFKSPTISALGRARLNRKPCPS